MEAYLNVIRLLLQHFEEYSIQQVSRNLNTQTDALASFGSTSEPNLRRSIPVGFIEEPSIQIEAAITADKVKDDWRTPIVTYLKEGSLPADKQEARKIRTKAARFSMISDCLYHRSFNGPYARCLDDIETVYVLKEIHEGECGNYSWGRSLCNKVKRQGYYWLSMLQDCEDFVSVTPPNST